MSSNDGRTSSIEHRYGAADPVIAWHVDGGRRRLWRHAAVNGRRMWWGCLWCRLGGGGNEPGESMAGTGRVRFGAPEPGGGARAPVRLGHRVLPGRGQGAGQVRDAASASGRRAAGDRGRGGARVLAGGVLPGVSIVRTVGHGRAARRAPRPPRPGETAPGDRGVHPRPGLWLGSGRGRSGSGAVRRAAASTDRRASARPVSTRSFWPPCEAAQLDYEALRAHLLAHDKPPDGLASARFNRRGLAGLIAWPAAEPVFAAELISAARPAWTPHLDPRVTALAAGYQFLLDINTAVLDTGPDTVSLAGRGPR